MSIQSERQAQESSEPIIIDLQILIYKELDCRVRAFLSQQEIPPWLREQLTRFEQVQQNLQAILAQKQQVEMEMTEGNKALAELKKAGGNETVYKFVGSILIKVAKDEMIKELEERRELSSTRVTVLNKQEAKVRESAKELQDKINEAVKGRVQPSS
jgi:prefoldin beta subunit|tara:strand:- start:70 stop:540 length:471 start_codon:yes stop_codon:yes gene_type:complete